MIQIVRVRGEGATGTDARLTIQELDNDVLFSIQEGDVMTDIALSKHGDDLARVLEFFTDCECTFQEKY